MKKCILMLSLLLTVHLCFAQTVVRPLTGLDAENNLSALVNQGSAMVRLMDSRYEGVKGTPFFLEQFGYASLYMSDNKVYENVRVNYNVHDNEVHYLDANNIERVISKTQLSHFVLKDSIGYKSYIFKMLGNVTGIDDKHKTKYALIPHEGSKTTLALILEKQLLKADFKGGYSSGRTFDELVNQKTYYLIKGNNITKVKLSKKALFEALSDKKQDIEHFVKQEKIDPSSEAGWVKTLIFYDSLH